VGCGEGGGVVGEGGWGHDWKRCIAGSGVALYSLLAELSRKQAGITA
jgi:hypothetical protein